MAAPLTNTFYFLRVEIAKINMHGDKFDIKHSTTLKSIMILIKDRQIIFLSCFALRHQLNEVTFMLLKGGGTVNPTSLPIN